MAPAAAGDLRVGPGAGAWAEAGRGAIRGITIGPIESGLHPGKGYGGEAFRRTLGETQALGANWVSLTPFGRVADLSPTGVSLTFEQPFEENRVAVGRAIDQAHAAGLRVLLVPHLWVESGGWRGEIDPGNDDDWQRWAKSYGDFLRAWATVARDHHVDMLALGVELRTWVTTAHAASFVELAHEIRALYPGLLTYASNWDDVDDAVLLGELDLIGVNAFFPLTEKSGASTEELLEGGARVATRLREIAERWGKPVVLTEFGYTTRADPALKPWEWPDQMSHVVVDQEAQAQAYFALLAPLMNEPWLAGAFACTPIRTICRKRRSGGSPRAASGRSSCCVTRTRRTGRQIRRGRSARAYSGTRPSCPGFFSATQYSGSVGAGTAGSSSATRGTPADPSSRKR